MLQGTEILHTQTSRYGHALELSITGSKRKSTTNEAQPGITAESPSSDDELQIGPDMVDIDISEAVRR